MFVIRTPSFFPLTSSSANLMLQVIRNTFQPLIGSGRELPRDLAPRLLRRFSSREGYSLAPGVDSLLRSLKQHKQQQQQQQRSCQIVVGVITNSDDRVPSILSSLGLRVSPVRFGSDLDPAEVVAGKQYDIDLHCMSYDVGFAKPDRRIFDAAEDMAKRIVATTRNDGGGGGEEDVPLLKLYVGDELEKDALGARAAGWNSVLVGPDGSTQPEGGFSELGRWGTLTDIFREGGTSPLMARVESTQMLLEWLIKEYQC